MTRRHRPPPRRRRRVPAAGASEVSKYIRRGREATTAERKAAESALEEMDRDRLDVCLAVAPRQTHEGHVIRTVSSRNPEWYREFALRGRCWVKRKRVVKALELIAAGWLRSNSYAQAVLDAIHT